MGSTWSFLQRGEETADVPTWFSRALEKDNSEWESETLWAEDAAERRKVNWDNVEFRWQDWDNRARWLRNSSESWEYPLDNDFARQILATPSHLKAPARYQHSQRLCDQCHNIDLNKPLSPSEVEENADRCDLCGLLARCLRRRVASAKGKTMIQLLDSRDLVRICAPADTAAQDSVQIGFPVLPASGCELYFALLRQWLQACDEHHASLKCHIGTRVPLPTRVVDVGQKGSSKLRIHCSTGKEVGADYIALSHCWGALTDLQKQAFCTTPFNIETRTRGFALEQLPQSFQDAVKVTRELGKRFLWIDSLCIIQGDEGDWKRESKEMGSVFRNAYCTIAASSAEDSTKGFLHRPVVESQETEYVAMRSSSHGVVYVCAGIDDFYNDVENSLLNQRAWVLQERAMSRRTIHFTSRQSYWECGMGIRCESLSHLRNSKALFLGDPAFPDSLCVRRSRDKIDLIQFLFKMYSRLGLSNVTDRSVAIASLEKSLAQTFKTTSRHGVLESHRHRSLLWRSPRGASMKRIQYRPPAQSSWLWRRPRYENQNPPSWSWMSYAGEIDFLRVPFDAVEWDSSLQFSGSGFLVAQVRSFWHLNIDTAALDNLIFDEADGLAQFGAVGPKLYCVVVGRDIADGHDTERQCYVLIVRPVNQSVEKTLFLRVGVGCIPETFVYSGGKSIKGFIV